MLGSDPVGKALTQMADQQKALERAMQTADRAFALLYKSTRQDRTSCRLRLLHPGLITPCRYLRRNPEPPRWPVKVVSVVLNIS
jgi:hypothetical protein